MTARERILTIKLLKKLEQRPEYAKQIGIQSFMVKVDSRKAEAEESENSRKIPHS